MWIVKVWRHRDLWYTTSTLVLLSWYSGGSSTLLLQGWCPWRWSNMSRNHDSRWRLLPLHLYLLLLCCGSWMSTIRSLHCRFIWIYLVTNRWLPVSIFLAWGPRDRAGIIRVDWLRYRARLHEGCSLDIDARFAHLIRWIWMRLKFVLSCRRASQARTLTDIVISQVVFVWLVVNISPCLCLSCALL